MTCWSSNTTGSHHGSYLLSLAANLRTFHARLPYRMPDLTERRSNAALANCCSSGMSSSSSVDCSTNLSSSSKKRTEGRKGLQSVAGIGPRNEQRLVSKGIVSVHKLTEVFNDQKKRNEEKMMSFLQVYVYKSA
jgi:hypothetical protein